MCEISKRLQHLYLKRDICQLTDHEYSGGFRIFTDGGHFFMNKNIILIKYKKRQVLICKYAFQILSLS
jgi:hypothetical protein